MVTIIFRVFVGCCAVTLAYGSENEGQIFDSDDSVTVTALTAPDIVISPTNDHVWRRPKRQHHIKRTSSCLTRRGGVGHCLTFRQCYPLFKLPVMSPYETWLSTMQGTCAYMTSSGKQESGICCHSRSHLEAHEKSNPMYRDIHENPIYQPGFPEPDSEKFPTVGQYPFPPVYWPPSPTHPPALPPTGTSKKPSMWPPTSSVFPGSFADAEEVTWNSAECGIKNGYQDQERIVGGHNAEPGEWPWMAALMNSGRLFCGGSLIDNIHVLTAAHCVAQMSPWEVSRLRIFLGDHNVKSKGDVEHVERRVKKVVRHRGFDPQTLYNDIAILTLDSPVKFTKHVRPICLSMERSSFSGKMATVIGWGSLKEMGPTPGILQEVTIPIWTNRQCKKKYGSAAPGGIVDSFLCAGKASKDSCSGDSGGPLMLNDGKWKQVGIVSWGIGCGKGQYPGVYTRISSFMSWIKKNMHT